MLGLWLLPAHLSLSTSHTLWHLIFLRPKVYTQADGKVCIHPKSVNAEETEFNYTWLIYHLKMRTSSVSGRGDTKMDDAVFQHHCMIAVFSRLSACCCVFLISYEWREGPVFKGWLWCHTSFTLNEYLIKTLPFNSLSKALVLQSIQTQYKRWWWKSKMVNAALWLLPSLSLSLCFSRFFLPLYSLPFSPPLHLSVFVLSVLSLSLWMFPILSKNTFHVLRLMSVNLSLTLLPSSLWRSVFSGFHCHHRHHLSVLPL